MTTFYTSDTHYFHDKIRSYSSRPFDTVEAMNEEMITRWNRRVRDGDTVYHLGDFCLGSRAQIKEVRARLRGHVILVLGNHDRSRTAMSDSGFTVASGWSAEISDGSHRLYLSHKPPDVLKYPGYDYWLCGHVHEKWGRRGAVINVGVDVRDFEPKTIEELVSA